MALRSHAQSRHTRGIIVDRCFLITLLVLMVARMVWNPCQKSLVYAGHLLFDGHLLFRGHMIFKCYMFQMPMRNPCQKSDVYVGHLLFKGHIVFVGHIVLEGHIIVIYFSFSA